MKEHPIIFSSEMVKAILEGRKTQTRRVIKSQPKIEIEGRLKTNQATIDNFVNHFTKLLFKCPYGQVGERLWVKETWATENRYNHLKPSEIPQTAKIFYLADGGYSPFEMGKVRSPLFMPRWASRITLENTSEARPERLQEITGEDVNREGITYENLWGKFSIPDWDAFAEAQERIAVRAFAIHWDSLNAKRGYSFADNPFVWCITFKRVE